MAIEEGNNERQVVWLSLKSEVMIETYKLLYDWSKWLIALETAICVSLWPKLTSGPKPPFVLYAGWALFVASIVTATLLVMSIAFAVRRLNDPEAKDLKRVRALVAIEYFFFLAGLTCFVWRMFDVWRSVPMPQ